MEFYTQLLNYQSRLNDQENEIINYLIANVAQLKKQTLKEVAEQLFVSPNTIVRAAKKLEFNGYSELKIAILIAKDTEQVKIEGVPIDQQIAKTKELLSRQSLDQILELLENAEQIHFFSCGLSKFPCEEMKEKLRMVGKQAVSYHEPHVMKQCARNLNNRSLVFVVSLTGETKTLVDAMVIAKTTGAKTISVTGLSQNSLSKLTDHTVFTFGNQVVVEKMDVANRLSFSYVFNVLFEEYVGRM